MSNSTPDPFVSRFGIVAALEATSVPIKPHRPNVNLKGPRYTDNPSGDSSDFDFAALDVDASSFGAADDHRVQNFTGALTTSDATPTSFASSGLPVTIPDKTSIDVLVTVIGKKTASGDTFCQDYRARYYRNGGALTLIGSVIAGANPIGTGSLSTASATILLSGNTIAPQVTGVAATSIRWGFTMQIQPIVTAT
jgi:hypothetical protein